MTSVDEQSSRQISGLQRCSMKEDNKVEELLFLGNDVVVVVGLAHGRLLLLLQPWVEGN